MSDTAASLPPSDAPLPPRSPRVRFAPSPTGFLHVGGARTALFNWLYARKYGGELLLRIEDTDRQRSTEESTRAIFEGLEWLGLDYDGEVQFQANNIERHRADVQRLLKTGAAYRDFTPPEMLEQQRADAEARNIPFRVDRHAAELPTEVEAAKLAAGEPYAVRFRVPEGVTDWPDAVHERIAFPNKDIDDFVILRSNGTPVYNLAVVSDDIAMGITLVLRGDDHISNTPKQILLYRALGAPVPEFAHVPMIHGTDGKKLSKRHGATAVGDYRHQGLLPSAMLNFLSLLGWSPGDDVEVMTRETMLERFSLEGLQRKAAIFDPQKLEWMNGQHLAMLPQDALLPHIYPAFERLEVATRAELEARGAWFTGLLDLLRVRARTVDDIVDQARPFLDDEITYEPDAVAKQWRNPAVASEFLLASHERLSALPAWEPAGMEAALRALAEELGVSGGKIFQPLRVALMGRTASPGIFDVLEYVGRERSLARLKAAVAWLKQETAAS